MMIIETIISTRLNAPLTGILLLFLFILRPVYVLAYMILAYHGGYGKSRALTSGIRVVLPCPLPRKKCKIAF